MRYMDYAFIVAILYLALWAILIILYSVLVDFGYLERYGDSWERWEKSLKAVALGIVIGLVVAGACDIIRLLR